MKIVLTTSKKADVLVSFSFEGRGKEFSGKSGQVQHTLVSGKQYRAEIKVGLGKKADCDVHAYLAAVSKGVTKAAQEGYAHAAVSVAEVIPDAVRQTTEAAIITARSFDVYKSTTKDEVKKLSSLSILGSDKAGFRRGKIVAEAVNGMRDLQDLRASDLGPADFAARAKKLALRRKLKCSVWDEKMLRKKEYNTILAVGQGSVRPPRLVTLKYTHPRAKQTICLVGKGITFDTGGYNLKPTGYIETMYYDMSGAALVLAVMDAIAQLKPQVNVIGIMGCADNMVSSTAYFPNDVIKTAAGITVEVGNTDAEGRLVLADCLYHATTFKPDVIIDFATLTGSVIVALGMSVAAILGNDEPLVESIIARGNTVGERLWPLPLFSLYDEDIKSKTADIKNLGYKREAGTITAASFLQKFVGEHKWAHLDIAGVSDVDRPRHFTQHGGTGWGVRTMVEWLLDLP